MFTGTPECALYDSIVPEQQARAHIDEMLAEAGWLVQNFKTVKLGASLGVAVRENPTRAGPADYALFIDRRPVGIVEAKKR